MNVLASVTKTAISWNREHAFWKVVLLTIAVSPAQRTMGFNLMKTLASLLALTPLLSHATPVVDTSAIQQAPVVQHFTSPTNPDISLQFVADSGVCETTQGVHQMSGYINVGTNMSMVCGVSRLEQLPLIL